MQTVANSYIWQLWSTFSNNFELYLYVPVKFKSPSLFTFVFVSPTTCEKLKLLEVPLC